MLFAKQEKRRKHPILTLAVGVLSAVGAVTVYTGVKHAVKTGAASVGNFCRRIVGGKQQQDAQ